ncbi:WD40-repeat-containing domain protein [Polychytrium aggregatum]|uniref:WD40-repeat-containing domain protein n=1 Tax=Polychytrium aggregatum TaxID=110093 RepID=UPI0022FEED98|nr:WD40-repeat-containing domain protein [Polychytrium aggregatum]KAI9208879.1 WD40-repeat-containing domain protein [Polychytrium aggregatum]
MRPILLKGHTRSLTKIRYNRDGDLLFTVSKDSTPSVWFSHNGERLGTYNGHNGTVWDLDISVDSRRLLTGSADQTCKMWDVYTGKCLFTWNTRTAVRAVSFAEGDKQALFVTDAVMGQPSTIHIVPIEDNVADQTEEPVNKIIITGSKATVAVWCSLNEYILTGHEDGSISLWDPATGNRLKRVENHKATIQDIQFSKDKTFFITASRDHSCQIYDTATLKVLKQFVTERPCNAAAISPIRPHIILGGGQDAMTVTQTNVKEGKFEVRFYHQVFEEEIGRVKGHFGPINTLAFHPDGKSFASGGEDGYVRLHHFDDDYFTFKFEEESLENYA